MIYGRIMLKILDFLLWLIDECTLDSSRIVRIELFELNFLMIFEHR